MTRTERFPKPGVAAPEKSQKKKRSPRGVKGKTTTPLKLNKVGSKTKLRRNLGGTALNIKKNLKDLQKTARFAGGEKNPISEFLVFRNDTGKTGLRKNPSDVKSATADVPDKEGYRNLQGHRSKGK